MEWMVHEMNDMKHLGAAAQQLIFGHQKDGGLSLIANYRVVIKDDVVWLIYVTCYVTYFEVKQEQGKRSNNTSLEATSNKQQATRRRCT